jgi:hypothetical protein
MTRSEPARRKPTGGRRGNPADAMLRTATLLSDQVLGPLVLPRDRADPFVGACLA